MHRNRAGWTAIVVVGVVACAFAARMPWHNPRAPQQTAFSALASPSIVSAAPPVGTLVNGAQPLIARGALLLSGEVLQLPTPETVINVDVVVGTQRIPASVRGQTYTALVPGDLGNAMVTVEVRANRLRYLSVLGGLDRQYRLAGADRQLDSNEQRALRVSPYSTALHKLVHYTLGRDAQSDDEFERGMRSLDGWELEVASSTIWVYAGHPEQLPAGVIDSYALLDDRVAFAKTVELFREPGAIANGFFAWQPADAPLHSLDDLPGTLLMMSALPANGLPTATTRVHWLERTGPSTFAMIESNALTNPRYTASVDESGRLLLTADGWIGGLATLADGTQPLRRNTDYVLRRLYQGEKYSQWYLELHWVQPRSVEDPWNSRGSGTARFLLTAINASDWVLPTQDWTLEPGTRALPWACFGAHVFDMRDCEYVQHKRQANGSGNLVDYGSKVDAALAPVPANRTGPDFTWAVQTDGSLKVVNSDASSWFWKVESADDGAGPVLEFQRSQRADRQMMERVGVGFTAAQRRAGDQIANFAGNWRGGFNAAQAWRYSDGPIIEFNNRNAEGSANWGVEYDHVPSAGRVTTSSLLNGAYFDVWNTAKPPATQCVLGPDGCLTRSTYFKPLRRVGQRYYGVEEINELFLANGWPNMVERTATRPAWYDCVGGACLGANGLEASGGGAVPFQAAWRPVMSGRAQWKGRAEFNAAERRLP